MYYVFHKQKTFVNSEMVQSHDYFKFNGIYKFNFYFILGKVWKLTHTIILVQCCIVVVAKEQDSDDEQIDKV